MRGIKDAGNDTLLLRVFTLILGLYPLALAALTFTMVMIKPEEGLGSLFIVLFALFCSYIGIKLLTLSFTRGPVIEAKLNKWLDVSGLDFFGFILFIVLMVLTGIFAWILTSIIRFFIPHPKYPVRLQKMNKL